MRSRCLKLALVIFVGWYVSGPLFMTFDWWDNAAEETQDIARSAGGITAIVGAAFLAGLTAFKKLSDRSAAESHRFARLSVRSLQLSALPSNFLVVSPYSFISMDASPPSPLRI
jgi:hypothetical protein